MNLNINCDPNYTLTDKDNQFLIECVEKFFDKREKVQTIPNGNFIYFGEQCGVMIFMINLKYNLDIDLTNLIENYEKQL